MKIASVVAICFCKFENKYLIQLTRNPAVSIELRWSWWMCRHGTHWRSWRHCPLWFIIALLSTSDITMSIHKQQIEIWLHTIDVVWRTRRKILFTVCELRLKMPTREHKINAISIQQLHWRHNDHDRVSKHQPYDCLLNCLIRRR